MKHHHRFHLMIAVSLTLAFAVPAASAATKAHAAPKAKTAEAAKPAGQVVEYAELESRVGQTVAIETTFKTMRTGKLVKYTQPTLTLQIGSDEKPMELTVPKE